MRVFNCWSKKEYIHGHMPQEFKEIAEILTCAQIEKLSAFIDNYYQRIRRQIEGSNHK